MALLAQFGLVWLSPACLMAWSSMSASAQPHPRKEALYCHSFGARAKQGDPNGCQQPWMELPLLPWCLFAAGEAVPYRLTAAAGTDPAKA